MADIQADIAGASQDLQTIEDFVNLPPGSDVRPRLLPSVNVGTLSGIRDAIFEAGGLPATPFKTKALMTASSLVDGDYAIVTEDTVNNGLYVKTAGTWVKSDYDPLGKANTYTDGEISSAIITAAADATTKADTAKSEAITAAGTDATTKADNAKSEAITAAATDATTKASAAKTEAIAAAAIDAEDIAKAEISKIAEFDSAGNNAYIFTDKNNTVLANLNSNAEFEANDFVTPNGTLNRALKGSAESLDAELSYAFTDVGHKILWGLKDNADVVSPYPPLQGLGVDAVRGKVLDNDSLNTAGAYLDRVASKNMKPINFEVLVALNGEDGRGHCRIGSIHQISETRFYVAYVQYETVNGELGGRFRAKFIDVDFDNETAEVGEARKLPQFEGVGTVGAGNSHFLTNKDEVILILHQNAELVTLVSYDECMTWTEVGRYSPKPSSFWMGLDSVAKIPDGQYKDRIVVGGFVSTISRVKYDLQSIYSDDFGRTWEVGYELDPETIGWGALKNETSVTTDCNNDLIFIVRDDAVDDPSIRKMFFGKSKDGGKTFTVFNPEKDTWAGSCPFGVAQAAPHVWDGIPKVLVTHPTKWGRWGLKLYISYNGCYSWATGFQLIPESIYTGYTYVNALSSQLFAVVYEHGSFNAFSDISVKFINTGAIYNDTSI